MRGGITAVAALVLLGALWFLAGDDDGRNAVPRLFDNMNDRPLAEPSRWGFLPPPRTGKRVWRLPAPWRSPWA